MKTKPKMMLLAVALILSAGFISCQEKKGRVEVSKDGVEIEGKKGGSLEMDKHELKIEGKDGGKVQIDKNGVEIETPKEKDDKK